MASQLGLFAAGDPMLAERARLAPLAARLDPRLHFGTSSWAYPGWEGLVYSEKRSEAELSRTGLTEYAQHPLLTTVGIDRSFYAPIPEKDFARYDGQLPPGFRACLKAPASVTSIVHLGDPKATPAANPDFLSPARYARDLGEVLQSHFLHRTAVVVFEFSPPPEGFKLPVDDFAARLDAFLGALPSNVRYAVELREQTHFRKVYAEVLARHRVAHVYNYWSAMPMPAKQARYIAPASQPFGVFRLMLAPGSKYSVRQRAFAPYDKLHEPDETMRAEVASLVRELLANGPDVHVLVNNKAEGSSPRTIEALASLIAAPPPL